MTLYKFRVYDAELGCVIYLEDMIERALNHKDRMLNGEVIVDCDAGNILMLMRSPESLIKWMQYTGLHDKNGKEIYEGDIIKEFNACGDETAISKIIWGGNSLCTGWMKKDIQSLIEYDKRLFEVGLSGARSKNIEVIGNIHENPDLLKEDNHAV